jgi:acyl carrier protein
MDLCDAEQISKVVESWQRRGRSKSLGTYVAPRTLTEATLAEIWARTLAFDKVSIHDHFFELGGDSLQATQLISRLRDAFGMELSMDTLFEFSTIASMAQYIEAAIWAAQALRVSQEESVIVDREEGEL